MVRFPGIGCRGGHREVSGALRLLQQSLKPLWPRLLISDGPDHQRLKLLIRPVEEHCAMSLHVGSQVAEPVQWIVRKTRIGVLVESGRRRSNQSFVGDHDVFVVIRHLPERPTKVDRQSALAIHILTRGELPPATRTGIAQFEVETVGCQQRIEDVAPGSERRSGVSHTVSALTVVKHPTHDSPRGRC
jgi:hypothetical protein